jgi:hypothetical protein
VVWPSIVKIFTNDEQVNKALRADGLDNQNTRLSEGDGQTVRISELI